MSNVRFARDDFGGYFAKIFILTQLSLGETRVSLAIFSVSLGDSFRNKNPGIDHTQRGTSCVKLLVKVKKIHFPTIWLDL